MGWQPSHTLEGRVVAASDSGIKGFEVCKKDVTEFADQHNSIPLKEATQIHALCKAAHVEVFALRPFENYKGEPTPLEVLLEKGYEWMQIAHKLNCRILQLYSSYSQDISTDEKVIVKKLPALADLEQRQDPPVSISYESLAWSVHIAGWSLRVFNLVARPNFILCLDTSHVLA